MARRESLEVRPEDPPRRAGQQRHGPEILAVAGLLRIRHHDGTKMIAAILFDLDGLLTDTETLHCRAYQRALEEVGYTLTEREFFEHWVRDGLAIADLCRLRAIGHEPGDLHKRKMVFYRELVRTDLVAMPGAMEMLRRVKGRRKLALVTASAKEAADAVLDTLGIRECFDVV